MSDPARDPLLDSIREALDRRAVPVSTASLARTIDGRSPREMADVARARTLRAGAGAAAVVLFGLLAFSSGTGGPPARDGSLGARLDVSVVEVSPSALASLAAPPLVVEEDVGRIDELALLSGVVFGDLR